MTTAFFSVEPRHVQLALLAMTRLSGLLLVTPPVQAPMVPVQVRVGVGFSLLFLMWPQLAAAAPPLAGDVLSLGGLAASELFIGVAIGFAGRLVVAAASFAGFSSNENAPGRSTNRCRRRDVSYSASRGAPRCGDTTP